MLGPGPLHFLGSTAQGPMTGELFFLARRALQALEQSRPACPVQGQYRRRKRNVLKGVSCCGKTFTPVGGCFRDRQYHSGRPRSALRRAAGAFLER